MQKANVFRSSSFHMAEGDVLHLLLLDEYGSTADIRLMSGGTTANDDEVPDAPTALDASDITTNSFTANWNFIENASGYYLDVATDEDFTAFVVGYEDLDVGYVNEYSVVGLAVVTQYFYRIRAYNEIGASDNSNVITLTTTYNAVFNDWFLPSENELDQMYLNLKVFGVGGFTNDRYWSSTESNHDTSRSILFLSGVHTGDIKSTTNSVRACRSFMAGVGDYALRDTGPSGGLVFYIDGVGTTYYEAIITDQSTDKAWSNITDGLIGTTSAIIGEGKNNTDEIIAQAGHTTSAAQLCEDLIVYT